MITIAVFVLAALDVAFFMWAVGQSALLDDARVDIDALQRENADLRADLAEVMGRPESRPRPTPQPRTQPMDAVVDATLHQILDVGAQPARPRGRHRG